MPKSNPLDALFNLPPSAQIDIADLSPWSLDWGDAEIPEIISDSTKVTLDHAARSDYTGINNEFTDEQLRIVESLKRNIRKTYNINTSKSVRRRAIKWCFVPGDKANDGPSFDDMCIALGARPDVIRARIQHQWFLSGTVLTDPLPFLAARMPDIYESEAIMVAWDLGARVCHFVWAWPSVDLPSLIRAFKDEDRSDLDVALRKLEEFGMLAWRFGRAYLIGRKAINRSRSFSWSKSFPY